MEPMRQQLHDEQGRNAGQGSMPAPASAMPAEPEDQTRCQVIVAHTVEQDVIPRLLLNRRAAVLAAAPLPIQLSVTNAQVAELS